MTAQSAPEATEATTPRLRAGEPLTHELRRAAVAALVLAVVGALAGLVWAVWSPPGPRALVVHPGTTFIPDETESFVAADGRYLTLAAVIGLVAALLVWFQRHGRGVSAVCGLVVGGLLGSLLMAFVGHLTGGGTFQGRTNTIIAQLPLSLHTKGLLLVEPTVAALVYGLLVAFAVHDDLGRPDPVRESLRPSPQPAGADGRSVGPGSQPEHGWGHGDAAGAPQQRDLPPQQARQPDQPF